MKVLVFGGRGFGWCRWDAPTEEKRRAIRQREYLNTIMDQFDMTCGIDLLIHGDCRGADKAAHKWAESRRVPVKPYPANWKRHGRAAGPIRNTEMLESEDIDAAIAFPGGHGTADMFGKCIDAGIQVIEIKHLCEDLPKNEL